MKKIKKTILFILKLGIVAGVVYLLVLRNPQEIVSCFRSFDLKWLVPAFGIYVFHMLICAWRWFRLTHVLQVKLGIWEAVSLSLPGYFFSLVIPGGAIGGDVVKMGVLAKRTPTGAKMEGAFTILMDRIIGMIALFLLALILLFPAYGLLCLIPIPGVTDSARWCWLPATVIGAVCCSGLAASTVIFFHRRVEKFAPVGFLMKKADERTHGMVSRMTAAADVYRRSWCELCKLVLLSIVGVHLMTVVPLGCILYGLNVEFSPLVLVTAVTVGNIVGLIPIFPSGVGGRDVTIIGILTAGGIAAPDARTAQLLYTLIVLSANLIGGIFFLFDPGRKKTRELLVECENE